MLILLHSLFFPDLKSLKFKCSNFTLVTRVYHFSLQYNEDRKMKALICSMGQRKSLFNRI